MGVPRAAEVHGVVEAHPVHADARVVRDGVGADFPARPCAARAGSRGDDANLG